MSEGDDDQPPQDGRQRQRSRDQVHPHAQAPQAPQVPQIQPMVIQELVTVLDEDLAVVNPSSPSGGPSPSVEQRGRSRRQQRSRSRERAHMYLHMLASSLNLLHLLLESSRSSLWPSKVRIQPFKGRHGEEKVYRNKVHRNRRGRKPQPK